MKAQLISVTLNSGFLFESIRARASIDNQCADQLLSSVHESSIFSQCLKRFLAARDRYSIQSATGSFYTHAQNLLLGIIGRPIADPSTWVLSTGFCHNFIYGVRFPSQLLGKGSRSEVPYIKTKFQYQQNRATLSTNPYFGFLSRQRVTREKGIRVGQGLLL